MARVIYHLDKRPARDGRHHIKLSLSHNKTTALIPTGVFVKPEHWFAGNAEIEPHIKKTCLGAKTMNDIIVERLEAVQERVNELVLNGTLNSFNTATQVKNHILAQIDGKTDKRGLFVTCLNEYAKHVNEPSRGLYAETLKKVSKYSDIERLKIAEMTVSWLRAFEGNCKCDGLAVNTIGRHLREIRAVYNYAINEKIVSLESYPFRGYKIKHEKTAKRSLTVEQLRMFRDYPCEPYQERYRDIFMLIFYLGGINLVDLSKLTAIEDGRIQYIRSKTGVHVDMAVPAEAQSIIDRYKGKRHLLAPFDEYGNYEDFLRRMDKELKKIGTFEMVLNNAKDPKRRKRNKKKITPLFPGLTTYWARHTVATLMAELDIPDATIDRVLAHADNSIAAIYIKRNRQKVDDAMRSVIDFVNV